MNDETRKVFWDTLCSLQGTNIKEGTDLLNKAIIYPKGELYFGVKNDGTVN